MKCKSIAVISHSSLDIFGDNIFLGGPVSYGGSLLRNLGADFVAVPMFSKDFPFLEYYRKNILSFQPIYSMDTTTFSMKFVDGRRETVAKRKADIFRASLIPIKAFGSDIVHLSPITNDMPITFIKDFKSKSGALIAIDPFNNDSGRFTKKERLFFLQLVKCVDVIKISENELLGLANESRFNRAKKFLEDFPNLFLVTRGAKGTFVFKKGSLDMNIPAPRHKNVVDTTGCGDIFLSGFLFGLASDFPVEKSVLFGNICASLSTKGRGPAFAPSKRDVEVVLNLAYGKNKGIHIRS
jgi:sugar/nucleoside kinase (ribokinase family)